MFKVVLMIDCDQCGHPLSQATVSSERNPAAWDAELEEMMYEAAKQGWDFYKDISRCPECGYKQSIEDAAIQPELGEGGGA